MSLYRLAHSTHSRLRRARVLVLPQAVICAAVMACVGVHPAFAQSTAAPPVGALSCSGCHGAGPDAALPLAQLSSDDIAAALMAFADGSRGGTLMPRIAKGFDADEIAAIALWIAEQGHE